MKTMSEAGKKRNNKMSLNNCSPGKGVPSVTEIPYSCLSGPGKFCIPYIMQPALNYFSFLNIRSFLVEVFHVY